MPPPPGSSVFRQRWAQFIKKVYEADPPAVSKILTHLGLWPFLSHAPPDSAVA
jgi:hypothetical protein